MTVKTKKEIQLESEVDKLKKMVEDLIKNSQNTKNIDDETNEIDAPFKKFIKVMSLTNNHLSLATGGYGKGKIYEFTEFGQVKNIIYDDLDEIVHNNKSFAEKGKFYIMDKKVVKLLALESCYEKFLTKDKILNLIDSDIDTIKSLFLNTTKSMQATIVSIIIDKMLNGEFVDLNKLNIISEMYGEDINTIVKGMKQNKD